MTEPRQDLRYPIGPMPAEEPATAERRNALIAEIAAAPARLREAAGSRSDRQLDTPYRPGGWTVRQVAHHLADSHINAYVRARLALTEDNPGIAPYDEAQWAELADYSLPVEVSVSLLESLHRRWVAVLESLAPADFARTFRHPDFPAPVTLNRQVAIYAWHGAHHVAQITALARREGW